MQLSQNIIHNFYRKYNSLFRICKDTEAGNSIEGRAGCI